MVTAEPRTFTLTETTVGGIAAAFAAKAISARELVQLYLNRIEAYDRNGPMINSVISLNPTALEDASRLDALYAAGGPVGPLHGIPVLLKDQMDAVGMPTTMGSLLFKDYYPDRDSFVTAKLRAAGAIILGKVTLGEMGGGDTHGSLFGSTRNPYDPERTVGGSSGGSGASAAANFAAVTIGQEGFASIRRPSAWNSCAGMRPTPGLVSRGGVYGGWPSRVGSLGPICRTVEDLAVVLDAIMGYDPDDPMTAYGVGQLSSPIVSGLDPDGLRGARIGILRTPMGSGSDPTSDDFAMVTAVFDRAVGELAAAGATLVDPIEIPNLNELIAKRAGDSQAEQFANWMARSANPPFRTQDEMMAHPDWQKVHRIRTGSSGVRAAGPNAYFEYLLAKDELMANVLKVMADNQLDAIVHKTVEHQPTLIREGIEPPYVNHKGAPHLNTFLINVPSITVPAGFTADSLPVGITFLGRAYSDPLMVKYAFAYEQSTMHRVSPASCPPLPGE